MTDVIVQGKPVEDDRKNPHNLAGLPGYDPHKDPNNAAYDEPNPNVLTGSYIPGSGLLPSIPPAVDDPTSEYYQNPAKSDFMHAAPSEVFVTPDGDLKMVQSKVTVVKEKRDVEISEVPEDSVPLAAGNPAVIEDKDAEKEAKERSSEAAKARKEELAANDVRTGDIMGNPSEAKGNSSPSSIRTQAQKDEGIKVAKEEAKK